MSRPARSVFLTAVLTASAVVIATLPAGAQTNEGLILSGKASAAGQRPALSSLQGWSSRRRLQVAAERRRRELASA